MNNFKNYTIFCILYQLLQHFAASWWLFKRKPSLNQSRTPYNSCSSILHVATNSYTICSYHFRAFFRHWIFFFERATLWMHLGCQTTTAHQFWKKKTYSFQCYFQYFKSFYFEVFHSNLLFFISEPLPNRLRMSNKPCMPNSRLKKKQSPLKFMLNTIYKSCYFAHISQRPELEKKKAHTDWIFSA